MNYVKANGVWEHNYVREFWEVWYTKSFWWQTLAQAYQTD